jgi:hypothetical protein
MLLELSREERQLLAELLARRLDEADVEEHRSETRRYKDMLHQEHALLEGLRGKVEALGEMPPKPPAPAK